jgi:hypothetical protein
VAYTKNLGISSSNRLTLSGSNVQVTGSLFASAVSGTTAQFTTISGSTITGSTGLLTSLSANDFLMVGGTTTSTSDVLIEARANTVNNLGPLIVINDAYTTSSTTAGTPFGRLTFRGYGGTTGNSVSRAEIRAVYDDTTGGCRIHFLTAPGNGGQGTKMILDSSGNLDIGNTSSPIALLSVTQQSTTSTSSYVADFRNSSTTPQAGRFMWSQGSTYGLALDVQGSNGTSATADFDWVVRSTGATQSTPLTLKYNGDVSIPNGNLVIGTSGKGIDFGVTTPDGAGASNIAETLNDYEEGTWTPVLNGATVTISERRGSYTKIGNTVYLSGYIYLSSRTTSANSIYITGLPFSAGATAYLGDSYTVLMRLNNSTTSLVCVVGELTAGTAQINIKKRSAAATLDSFFLGSDLSSISVIWFSVVYNV